MIQRLQTIWLFLAAVAIFLMYFFPFIGVQAPESGVEYIMTGGQINETIKGHLLNEYSLWWVNGAIATCAIYFLSLIFLYKNLKLQSSLSLIGIVVVGFLGIVLSKSANAAFRPLEFNISNYKYGALMPSLAIVFSVLAFRWIRKDEKTLRSLDRMR